LLDGGEGGVKGAKNTEDVGFELTAVIIEKKLLEGADHAEAGVGDDNIEFAVGAKSFGDGALELVVAPDVAFDDEGSGRATGGDLLGEAIEQFPSPGREGETSAGIGELVGEFFADTGRSACDKDRFVPEEGIDDGHGKYGNGKKLEGGEKRPSGGRKVEEGEGIRVKDFASGGQRESVESTAIREVL